MLPEDEKRDELLSAYFDNALGESERLQAEKLLAEDKRAQARADSFHDLSSSLKTHFESSRRESAVQAQGGSALGSDFSARVIAAAQADVIRRGDRDHFVLGKQATENHSAAEEEAITGAAPDLAENVVERAPEQPSFSWTSVVAVLGGLAAVILLVASLSGLFRGDQDSGGLAKDPEGNLSATDPSNLANENEPVNPFPRDNDADVGPEQSIDPLPPENGAVEYVGEMDFPPILYLVMLDLEIDAKAYEDEVFEKTLSNAGIKVGEPIAATQEVQDAIGAARTAAGDQEEAPALIYLVRAPLTELSTVLEKTLSNFDDYPHVAMDLGFDVPQINLLKKLAKNTGKRFSVNESFSVPFTNEASNDSSFDFPAPKYISTTKRTTFKDDFNVPNTGKRMLNMVVMVRVTGN
ncbi:MAG: hypothetical protein AAF483_04415 [Planctomycetota bacterium]